MGYLFFFAVLLRAAQESSSFHLYLPRASGLRNLLKNIQKIHLDFCHDFLLISLS